MEPVKNETDNKKTAFKEGDKRGQRRRIIIWVIIIFLLLFGLYFLFEWFLSTKTKSLGNTISVNQPNNTFDISQNNSTATTTPLARKSDAIASSENFEMLQINLEGSGTSVFDFGENEIFSLSNVMSELYTTKEGDTTEIRAAISFQTNKRSYAEVEYYKSGEQVKKVFKDTYLGFNHTMVIPALDPDSVYRYAISATDINQTKIYSEQYVFYTGVGNISLVDVLSNAVQKVFGWTLGQ